MKRATLKQVTELQQQALGGRISWIHMEAILTRLGDFILTPDILNSNLQQATLEQFTRLTGLVNNGKISREKLQEIIRFPSQAFASSIIKIDRSTPFNPATYVCDWIIDKEDNRSLALTELHLADIDIVMMLEDEERMMSGEEWLTYLRTTKHIPLDAKLFQIFFQNTYLIPKSWIKYEVFFDGTTILDSHGRLCTPSISFSGGMWLRGFSPISAEEFRKSGTTESHIYNRTQYAASAVVS